MIHFVYIIKNNIYYKGYSKDAEKRIENHNAKKSTFTKNKGPWNLVFIKSFSSSTEALKFEKMLKRQSHKYLDWIIESDKNELKDEGRLGLA